MEEGIKILEDFINNEFQKDKLEMNEKGGFKIGTIYKVAELSPAIANLIKRNRELEEKEKSYNTAYDLGKAFANKQWESKIKEKIEELETQINDYATITGYCKDIMLTRTMGEGISVLKGFRDLLQKLMEEK